MNNTIPANFNDLWSGNRELQNKAFFFVLEVTNSRVDWAHDVWNELLENLNHKDNHNRAIAAQILCNLAKSEQNAKGLQRPVCSY